MNSLDKRFEHRASEKCIENKIIMYLSTALDIGLGESSFKIILNENGFGIGFGIPYRLTGSKTPLDIRSLS